MAVARKGILPNTVGEIIFKEEFQLFQKWDYKQMILIWINIINYNKTKISVHSVYSNIIDYF